MVSVVFVATMVSATKTLCRGDGDCAHDQICLHGYCWWMRNYGETCEYQQQCRGFNMKCLSNKCVCDILNYEYDNGNCRKRGSCRSQDECGPGYWCNTNSLVCELVVKPPLSKLAIISIIIGVLVTVHLILVAIIVAYLNKRKTLS